MKLVATLYWATVAWLVTWVFFNVTLYTIAPHLNVGGGVYHCMRAADWKWAIELHQHLLVAGCTTAAGLLFARAPIHWGIVAALASVHPCRIWWDLCHSGPARGVDPEEWTTDTLCLGVYIPLVIAFVSWGVTAAKLDVRRIPKALAEPLESPGGHTLMLFVVAFFGLSLVLIPEPWAWATIPLLVYLIVAATLALGCFPGWLRDRLVPIRRR